LSRGSRLIKILVLEGFSASSSLRLRRLFLYFALSRATLGLASTSLTSMLFRLRLPFCGVSPGSRSACENKSLRLSRAILGVVGLNFGGSKSDSISDGETGAGLYGAEVWGGIGTRDNRARNRAAGVSAGGALGRGGVVAEEDIFGVCG